MIREAGRAFASLHACVTLSSVLVACGSAPQQQPVVARSLPATPSASAAREPARITARAAALPGVGGHASLDFLLLEPGRGRVWVPVGDTGSVDVFDPASQQFTRIDGFATVERDAGGKKRTVGPSSAAFGDGVVYVGDRASSEVCAVDAASLQRGACIKLESAPDCLAYVASSRELWVTTPKSSSVTVLDASRPAQLKPKAVVPTPGSPEGFAVDDTRGLFFTNLEDKDQTLAVDVKSRAVVARWSPACGGDGPRGVAVDAATQLVVVACTDHLQVLDGRRGGAPGARLETGGGVDGIDWVPASRLLYVAAARDAKLTVARLGEDGTLAVVATVDTAPGARNAVADPSGTAYLADPQAGGILVVPLRP